jgi:hypothetical protein
MLTVPPEDVAAGVEKMYDIQGTQTHNHVVTLTAADFTSLATDGTITVESSAGGPGDHTHMVTINCMA